ncbi:aspartyl-phosphate phosphatase Spo0E family protein [Clostridium fermenticellae]|uniref:Aspartyl-phosphate phosphatase Spo0E family protein n=1 Tax=Clostridium fermenticellae TaxID=2068654 RepID=A0A386H3P3_9CLOT|nr:aspartyl-phosphate phosphatase Spo0E family protein [Clostridium fermenticellae]AYD40276.1 aspartyl-phosphate phosphatase Spo0E family protein [Clostridium fermenticellae]
MKLELNIIDKKINNMREVLYNLLDDNELTNEIVVNYSQKLDNLILEYQKLIN